MNGQQAEHAGPFFDPFACFEVALASARQRNKWAVRARKKGDFTAAIAHTMMRDFYMGRCRIWHDMIDWSDE